MIEIVKAKQKEPRALFWMGVYFIIFLILYTLLDRFNGGYLQMSSDYGWYLAVLNIGLNLLMSSIGAYMLGLSTTFMQLTGLSDKGSHATFLSVIFGMFTYGCTPCLVTFFATFGITLTVAVLPLMGLPYKLISLILLICGYFYLIHEIKRPKCSLPKGKDHG